MTNCRHWHCSLHHSLVGIFTDGSARLTSGSKRICLCKDASKLHHFCRYRKMERHERWRPFVQSLLRDGSHDSELVKLSSAVISETVRRIMSDHLRGHRPVISTKSPVTLSKQSTFCATCDMHEFSRCDVDLASV